MMNEMNHRFGFYLISVLMIVMLIFIYLDVRRLNADVNALLQSTQNEMNYNPAMYPSRDNELIDPAIDLEGETQAEVGEDADIETSETPSDPADLSEAPDSI
jgi:hypothetical protein